MIAPINEIMNAGPTTLGQKTSTGDELGKQEFLTLLVAQLKNQDPLSPLESQEFAAQLAQFSSVEQLTSIDTNIKDGIDTDMVLSQTINNTLATALIGKEVTAQGNRIEFNGEDPVKLYYMLPDYADSVNIDVLDGAGNVVRTLSAGSVSDGIRSLEWDGKDKNGNMLPEGGYSFEVSAVDRDGQALDVIPLIKGLARSLQYNAGGAVLMVGNTRVSFGDVLEISAGLGDNDEGR